MAYVITRACVGTCDTACVAACPVDCIAGPVPLEELRAVPEAERGAKFPGVQMFIDPDACVCCGACLPHCPVAAIHDEPDVPPHLREDVERNARFFRERAGP